LLGLVITVIRVGEAGVRISQISGTHPGTLYPGVHWIMPRVNRIETFSIRDHVFTTATGEDPKKMGGSLRVQSKEGPAIGLAVAVRYRLDPSKLTHIQMDLPRPVEAELAALVVAGVFRELAPNYMVREIFATRREELRKAAAVAIAQTLGADGLVVREVTDE
ncbi:MAG: hypothetical protein LC126_25860, partial [Bryobacterales bacterium]|nr:hypothetical protein [Bryobacterales bacterium]